MLPAATGKQGDREHQNMVQRKKTSYLEIEEWRHCSSIAHLDNSTIDNKNTHRNSKHKMEFIQQKNKIFKFPMRLNRDSP